jgi:hypothetical protein
VSRQAQGYTGFRVLLLLLALHGTTVRLAPHDVLVARADVIAVGRVAARECLWQGRRIVTRYRVDVSEVWKGAPVQWLTLELPGGVVGTLGQQVAGTPSFAEGERLLVYGVGVGEVVHPVALGQGVFRLQDGRAERVLDVHVIGPEVTQPLTEQALRDAALRRLP